MFLTSSSPSASCAVSCATTLHRRHGCHCDSFVTGIIQLFRKLSSLLRRRTSRRAVHRRQPLRQSHRHRSPPAPPGGGLRSGGTLLVMASDGNLAAMPQPTLRCSRDTATRRRCRDIPAVAPAFDCTKQFWAAVGRNTEMVPENWIVNISISAN